MTSVDYTVLQLGPYQIAFCPAKRSPEPFVAWGKRGIIEGPDAIREPGDVWFNFGKTPDDAVQKTLAELIVATHK